MDALAAFLYDRFQEEIEAEQQRRRSKPSIFDEYDIEIRSEGDGIRVYVDGFEYPTEEYLAAATEPDTDRLVVQALHMRQRLLDFTTWPSDHDAVRRAYAMTLAVLAKPYERHPDFPQEDPPVSSRDR